jgi:multiple sugar transport system substrate-binding protein
MKNGYFLILLATVWLVGPGCGSGNRTDGHLTIWAHEGQPAEKEALIGIFKRFNEEHPDLQVRVEFKQEQGYGERVNAAALAGDLPDIIEVDGPFTAHLAENGILVPLAGLISKDILDDFLPTITAQGTYRGSLYTLGAFESTVVLYGNTALLSACGIRLPEDIKDAWTWKEFLNVLRKIKKAKPGIIPLETFMVWGGEWLTYAFSPLVWSNQGRLLSADGRTAEEHLNGPATVTALREWQKLFTEKLTDLNAPAGQFRQGRAALAWGIFNRWPLYQESGIAFNMAPLPRFKEPVSPSGSWCWGITSQCRERRQAARVLQWITHPQEGILPICKANAGIPARNSAISLVPDYQRTRGLFIKQLRNTARSRPATPHYGTVSQEVSRALGDIARGARVEKVLQKAAERIDLVLKESS